MDVVVIAEEEEEEEEEEKLKNSQGLARLRFSKEVEQADIDEAIRLMYESKKSLYEEVEGGHRYDHHAAAAAASSSSAAAVFCSCHYPCPCPLPRRFLVSLLPPSHRHAELTIPSPPSLTWPRTWRSQLERATRSA